MLVDDSDEEVGFEDCSFIIEKDESTLEALSGDVTFSTEKKRHCCFRGGKMGLIGRSNVGTSLPLLEV